MKEYNLYVASQPQSGPRPSEDPLAWLRDRLTERFGGCEEMSAFHEGAWNTSNVDFTGPVKIFIVRTEEAKARSFFTRLKRELLDRGFEKILVLEKGAIVGERI